MNKIANKQVINDVLLEESAKDKDIIVLCSDSRGSAGMKSYAEQRPEQFVEVGIAEQNLVGISAGLALLYHQPASFLQEVWSRPRWMWLIPIPT